MATSSRRSSPTAFRLQALLFSVAVAFNFASAQNIFTDRPTQAVGSTTMLPGTIQVETGTFLVVNDDNTPSTYWAISSNLFRYGLVRNLELRMFSELGRIKEVNMDKGRIGISDLQLGLKYRIIGNDNIEFSYMGHLLIPNGSIDVTNSKFGVINKLLLSHTIGSKLGIGYNLGFDHFGEDRYFLTYAVAVSYPITDRLGYFVEAYGDWFRFDNWSTAFDTGFVYLIKSNLQADFSLGFRDDFNFYSAGISWRLPNGDQ